MAHAACSVLSPSPTFTSYSSNRLADIAARVVEEFRNDGDVDDDDFGFGFGSYGDDFCEELEAVGNENEVKIEKIEDGSGDNGQPREDEDEEEEEEEDEGEDGEFEFAFFPKDSVSSPAPADEIFYNGQIRPVYPLFDTSLLYDVVGRRKDNEDLSYERDESTRKPPKVRLPLSKLFTEERELSNSSSCSSSEADELEGAAPGTYCVWNPKSSDADATGMVAGKGQCKKSNSTGSSKRWRFRDLLHRSSSDGKERFVFINQANREEKFKKNTSPAVAGRKVADNTTAVQPCGKSSGERRRESYLPYRQDLVGIFSNVHGFSRN